MTKTGWLTAKAFLASTVFCAWLGAQSPPPSPDVVWHGKEEPSLEQGLASQPEQRYAIDPEKSYTLPELINLAEEHNPVTRQAWETATARADSLGIAKSALYPTISAVALAATTRDAALIGEYFHRQTIGISSLCCMSITWCLIWAAKVERSMRPKPIS